MALILCIVNCSYCIFSASDTLLTLLSHLVSSKSLESHWLSGRNSLFYSSFLPALFLHPIRFLTQVSGLTPQHSLATSSHIHQLSRTRHWWPQINKTACYFWMSRARDMFPYRLFSPSVSNHSMILRFLRKRQSSEI